LFMGDICTGSTQDLKHATGMAEKMVTMFGMSDKLGPLYYGQEEETSETCCHHWQQYAKPAGFLQFPVFILWYYI